MFTLFSLRRYTIRSRMLGTIALVLSLLAMVGAAGLIGLRHVDRISDDFVEQVHAGTVTLTTLRTAIGHVRRFEKDLLINYDSAAEVAAYRGKWSAAVDEAHQAAGALAKAADAEEAAAAGQIDTLVKQYADGALLVFKQIEAGGVDSAPAANKAIGPAKKLIEQAEEQVKRVHHALDQQAAASALSQNEAVKLANLVFVATLALAVVLVVPLTLANMASICRPIDRARQLAEHIATGDLSTRIVDAGRDEAASLLHALDAMQVSLRGIVGQVRETAESIQVASAEVATGNTDLSQRTELTASNLQQTASAIEQLTANVRQSADAAAQANQLAASASSVAQRGGAVVSQVVTTMDEINTSSKRIADIIGTIDGIAFQTNILALNAAVEAARAGEQGRGFAVVASEVRSLAQRSAEAAREIKSLIGSSVDKVETGARLVQDAGSTMGEIVASVQRVSDIIGEISAATAEQSSGFGSVNSAIGSLDQMTQQNAALVEESAAAAESLKDQARRLGQSMQVFRLSGTGGPVAMADRPLANTATISPAAAVTPARPAAARPPAAPKPPPRRATAAVASAASASKPAAPTAPPPELARAVISQARESSRSAPPAAADDWESF